jgi:hypothetical protein
VLKGYAIGVLTPIPCLLTTRSSSLSGLATVTRCTSK